MEIISRTWDLNLQKYVVKFQVDGEIQESVDKFLEMAIVLAYKGIDDELCNLRGRVCGQFWWGNTAKNRTPGESVEVDGGSPD